MIDFEDAEWTALLAPSTLLGVCVVLVVLGIAFCNSSECGKVACPNGGHAELYEHECKCIEPAPVQP